MALSKVEADKVVVVLRCQFCNALSSDPAPYEPRDKAKDKWWPKIAWFLGTRDTPRGLTCLICANVPLLQPAVVSTLVSTSMHAACLPCLLPTSSQVHESGGWSVEIGSVYPEMRQPVQNQSCQIACVD